MVGLETTEEKLRLVVVAATDLRAAAEAADRRTAAERNILIYLEVNRGRGLD